jgi:hypothetical protein
MEHPPFWLMLLGSSVFGLLTRAKAIKYQKNKTLWFWLGFIFGVWGFIAFYLTKKSLKPRPNANQAPALPNLKLDACNWYYSLNQNVCGPSSSEYIKNLYLQGILTDETLVWNESLTEWTALKNYKA